MAGATRTVAQIRATERPVTAASRVCAPPSDPAGRLGFPFPRLSVARLVLPGLMAAVLAGCAGGEGLDGSFGAQDTDVAGGTAIATPGGTSAGVVNSATSGSLVVGAGPDQVSYDCPMLTVRTGAGSWQVTAGGGLRYQATIGRLARECTISNGMMLVKVGIEGRVLMGEKGSPGQVKVPVRIAVVNEGPSPKTVTTKFFAVAVDVPADPGHAPFTVVEDQIAFPLLKPYEMERYIIYVGFDPQGTPEVRERPKPSVSRPKPKPPATAAQPAPAPAAASAPAPASSSSSSSSSSTSKDVFGPPPSSGGSSGGSFAPPPSSGGFAPPPSTSTFAPPPK